MRFAALGFTVGVWLLQHQPELPGAGWLAFVCALAAIGAVGFSRRVSPIVAAGATFIGFAALGFIWAGRRAQRMRRILEADAVKPPAPNPEAPPDSN